MDNFIGKNNKKIKDDICCIWNKAWHVKKNLFNS